MWTVDIYHHLHFLFNCTQWVVALSLVREWWGEVWMVQEIWIAMLSSLPPIRIKLQEHVVFGVHYYRTSPSNPNKAIKPPKGDILQNFFGQCSCSTTGMLLWLLHNSSFLQFSNTMFLWLSHNTALGLLCNMCLVAVLIYFATYFLQLRNTYCCAILRNTCYLRWLHNTMLLCNNTQHFSYCAITCIAQYCEIPISCAECTILCCFAILCNTCF